MYNSIYLPDEICEEHYSDFIDYALKTCTAFMLVYCSYEKSGYSYVTKTIKNRLKKSLIKKRNDTQWPGTVSLNQNRFNYSICFYKIDETSKEVLLSANSLYDWSRTKKMPEDLAFFRNDMCWSFCTGHESTAGLCFMDKKDREFVNQFSEDLYSIEGGYTYTEEF